MRCEIVKKKESRNTLSVPAFPSLSLQTMEDQEFEMVRSISNQPYYSASCIICQANC